MMRLTGSKLILFLILMAFHSLGAADSQTGVLKLDGERYKATVPDTLDLAERARLSVNALTGLVDPARHYDTYHCAHIDFNPAEMSHRWGAQNQSKIVHVLPLIRVMSGSTQHEDYDRHMLDSLVREIDKDGVWWIRVEGRPWRLKDYKHDQFWAWAHGRTIVALATWYGLTRDPALRDLLEKMARGTEKIAGRKDDRAWIQDYKKSNPGLASMAQDVETIQRGGVSADKIAAEAGAAEPASVPGHALGTCIWGLAQYSQVGGDRAALDLARQCANFMLKPKMWPPGDGPSMINAADLGASVNHFHSSATAAMGLLDYAIAAHDVRVERFVRDFYEYARKFGIPRIGFFPAVVGPLKTIRESNQKKFGGPGQVCEGCAIGNMTWLAVKLSEAGIGDYWEDVDQYVRNHLIEHQLVRRDLMEVCESKAARHAIDPLMETNDRVIERNIGCFVSTSDPTWLYPWFSQCCNANIPVGLYAAWKGIVRCEAGRAQVNLLLNRASPWLDLDSYLPYEGKVVIRNKTAQELNVRLPLWADKSAVRCRVNGQARTHGWLGNYLLLGRIKNGDVITIEFPMVETTESYTELTYGKRYTIHFKGNTVVDISPRPASTEWNKNTSDDGSYYDFHQGYPIYQRDGYKGSKAPMIKVERYVHHSH